MRTSRKLAAAAVTIAAIGGTAGAVAAAGGFANTSGPIEVLETHVYGPNSRGASYTCVRINGLADNAGEWCVGWNPASTVPGHRTEQEAWATLFSIPAFQYSLAQVAERTPRTND